MMKSMLLLCLNRNSPPITKDYIDNFYEILLKGEIVNTSNFELIEHIIFKQAKGELNKEVIIFCYGSIFLISNGAIWRKNGRDRGEDNLINTLREGR